MADILQRAFDVLGGVEWEEHGCDYLLVNDKTGMWVSGRQHGTADWNWDHYCSDHEVHSLLLNAMIAKAEEKWGNVAYLRDLYWSSSPDELWRVVADCGYENQEEIGVGPTLFSALLNALEGEK